MRRAAAGMLSLLIVGCGGGCYKTIYRTGAPVGLPSAEASNPWHMGAVNGFVEITQLPPIDQLCPLGLAEVRTQETFLNGLVNSLTNGLLYFQSVAVYCGVDPGPYAGK